MTCLKKQDVAITILLQYALVYDRILVTVMPRYRLKDVELGIDLPYVDY
jgi:hypothetical protein